MSRLNKLFMALGFTAAVVTYAPLVALAEPPIEAHLIAPEGADLVTHPQGPTSSDHGNFLDVVDGLDVHRQTGALGIVERGDNRVMVTAVRLRDADEAARALSAFGHGPPGDPTVEVLPEIAPDTITHRITNNVGGAETTLVEVARATGRDFVVFAQIDLTAPNVEPFTRQVITAHLAAFPNGTPPATAGHGMRGLLFPAALGAGVVVAALGLVSLRSHRKRPPSMTPAPNDPGEIRMNW